VLIHAIPQLSSTWSEFFLLSLGPVLHPSKWLQPSQCIDSKKFGGYHSGMATSILKTHKSRNGSRRQRLTKRGRFDFVQFRASVEWREWLYALARKHGISASELLAVAVERIAAETGFEPPPPR
jgi:hypothetical protein